MGRSYLREELTEEELYVEELPGEELSKEKLHIIIIIITSYALK